MKRMLLNCALLLLATTGMAQPVITAANIFKPGNWYTNLDAETAGVAIGSTGPNQVWNYNGLVAQPNSQDFLSAALPAFPSGVSLPPIFSSANIMLYSITPSGLSGTDTSYEYYKASGDTLFGIGSFRPKDRSLSYAEKPTILFPYYPFTYGDSCMDSTLSINIDSIGVADTIGLALKLNVTGYGTLILPGNRTFNNVLQVTRRIQVALPFGVVENTVQLYLTPGNSFPLMLILIFNGEIENIEYMTNSYVAPVGPTYTFTGNGNWNNPANWQGGTVPPANLPAGGRIFINPAAGGTCTLNVPYTVPLGCQFTVQTGAKLLLPGNLTIL